jgi:hypothetical protein
MQLYQSLLTIFKNEHNLMQQELFELPKVRLIFALLEIIHVTALAKIYLRQL